MAVKPIHHFNHRWLALLERVRSQAGGTTIAVVGGGAGGVELTLAMQYRLRNELSARGGDPDELRFHLFTASDRILPTHNAGVRRRFERVLKRRAAGRVTGRCSAGTLAGLAPRAAGRGVAGRGGAVRRGVTCVP